MKYMRLMKGILAAALLLMTTPAAGEPLNILNTGAIQPVVLVDETRAHNGIASNPLYTRDFMIEVAKEKVAGHRQFRIFGERPVVGVTAGGEDIWPGAATTIPRPADVGEQMTFVSTSVNDTAAGTGVQEVEIMYLDAAGAELVERIATNGTTPVNSTATNIRFVNTFHATAVGSGGVAAGDIKLYKTGAASTEYNWISAGGNMSLTAVYMVPAGMTAYILHWGGGASGNKAQSIRLRTDSEDGDPFPGVFTFKESTRLVDNIFRYSITPSEIIPELTVIKVSTWAEQAGGWTSGGFDGVLVENGN